MLHLEKFKAEILKNGFAVLNKPKLKNPELVNLAKEFGIPQVFADKNYCHPENDMVFVSNSRPTSKSGGMKRIGLYWHQDSSFTSKPLNYTLLYCMKAPLSGGETEFISVRKLTTWFLETFPKLVMLNPLVEHDSYHRYIISKQDIGKSIQEIIVEDKRGYPSVKHRLIKKHPLSKEKLLYVNEGFSRKICGLSLENSSIILDSVFKRTAALKSVIHKWSPGDLLVWDNNLVLHKAHEVDKGHKLLHRVGIV